MFELREILHGKGVSLAFCFTRKYAKKEKPADGGADGGENEDDVLKGDFSGVDGEVG